MKTSQQIRNDFLSFFKQHDHVSVPSAPVVPQDDPSLLFTNAGMNQFKAVFLGDNPRALKRAANSQKCMRVSGKHNDLEEVGRDHYHHTFFEMLGNWSFGDYYKKEAIRWGWELLTVVWKIPKDRLFATVYADDDEALECWKSETDIAHNRILRFGEKHNFWEMGETGPCGPCSEIHFDTGDAATREATFSDSVAGINGENARYRELWNLVFIQYNREKDDSLTPLASKHVDTGMGFERIVAVIQGADSNYHTDIFKPVITSLETVCGRQYRPGSEGTPFRVAADHVRSLVFAITDGAFPSNEGRGYVLRRLLRRAAKFGRELGCSEPYLYRLVPAVIDVMGGAFPEIRERRAFVEEVIRSEEERFAATLEQGLSKFSVMVASCEKSGTKELDGADVFALYDTYGFPVDLTRLMAAEKGLSVDDEEFNRRMEQQKARGREARRSAETGLSPEGWIELSPVSGTAFVGYDADGSAVRVCRYKPVETGEGTVEYLLIFDKTPFYAASGGQVGDTGEIVTASGKTLTVSDTVKWNELTVHRAVSVVPLVKSDFERPLHSAINVTKRNAIRRNHTATHLLQAALRKVLGTHVQQSGSRVDAEGLRFDFSHFKAMTKDELAAVEHRVNEWVLADVPVTTVLKDPESAKKEGAIALFGEKYGDSVRVVSVGPVSMELCGGTHVSATGQIGLFHITGETSIAAGVRRIEAITGIESLRYLTRIESGLHDAATLLKTNLTGVAGALAALVDETKTVKARLEEAGAAQAARVVAAVIDAALSRPGALKWAVRNLGVMDRKSFTDAMNAVSDTIKEKKLDTAAIVLGGVDGGAVMLAAVAGDKAAKAFGVHCGEIVKAAAARTGGTGGGSPLRAQAGGKNPQKLDDALAEASSLLAGKAGA
ncbi:MAG: alanine--tRNA ligase [Chitinispirillaceae bacterium]|nr:alanine--tRNA ligase [Chitinispirillaceae bacterium]